MKFYNEKDVPQEGTPILNRVGRRDTVSDLAREIKSDHWHQMAMRTLSGPSSRETEDKYGRSSSNTPSFVITDSSWIYTSMKEAANEVFNSHPNLEEQADLASSKQRSKTCCRLTVSTIIALCIIGILSAIGGIIYLEFFAFRQTERFSLPDHGDSSVKLSEYGNLNGNADWENVDLTRAVSEQTYEHPGEFDLKLSTRPNTSRSPRRGKGLSEDETYTPDVSLLKAYVNATISVVKSVYQIIKDANEQERSSRGLDLPKEQQDDSSQSFLQKITTYLFGVRRSAPVKNTWNFNMLEENETSLVSYIDESYMYNKEGLLVPNGDQIKELGSGEIDKTSNETDLTKVITPMLTEIFLEMGTLQAELGGTNFQNFENKNTFNVVDLPDKSFNPAVAEVQRTTTAEGPSPYSDFGNKISDSIAGLLKIFRNIDRVTSFVTSPSSNDLQENIFQRRVLENETGMLSATGRGSVRQEREQYLQRLRNIMLTANAMG